MSRLHPLSDQYRDSIQDSVREQVGDYYDSFSENWIGVGGPSKRSLRFGPTSYFVPEGHFVPESHFVPGGHWTGRSAPVPSNTGLERQRYGRLFAPRNVLDQISIESWITYILLSAILITLIVKL